MKNKRLCALLLTIAMCFCFVSCTSNTQTVDKESTTAQSTSKAKNENKEKENKTTVKITTSNPTTKKNEPTVKDEISYTINVECKSILNNIIDKLKDGHSEYMPADGYIIKGHKHTTKKNEPTVKDEISCTLTVECKSILNNMDKLKDGHSEYVPADGYIITGYKYTAKAGFTAYDVLKKACEDNGIKLTAKSSMYGTYVSGINNIDEFDCGSQSGWMFSINGNRPNVSASSQKINDGDEITFEYVCEYQ